MAPWRRQQPMDQGKDILSLGNIVGMFEKPNEAKMEGSGWRCKTGIVSSRIVTEGLVSGGMLFAFYPTCLRRCLTV